MPNVTLASYRLIRTRDIAVVPSRTIYSKISLSITQGAVSMMFYLYLALHFLALLFRYCLSLDFRNPLHLLLCEVHPRKEVTVREISNPNEVPSDDVIFVFC